MYLALQTKEKVREERRAFVRELHPSSVDLVVDLDLFVRSIRAAGVAGAHDEAKVRATIEAGWKNDLLRRFRASRPRRT